MALRAAALHCCCAVRGCWQSGPMACAGACHSCVDGCASVGRQRMRCCQHRGDKPFSAELLSDTELPPLLMT